MALRILAPAAVIAAFAAVTAANAGRDDAYRPPNGDTGSYLGQLPADQGRYQTAQPDYRSAPPDYRAPPAPSNGGGDVYYPPSSSGRGSDAYRPPAGDGYPRPQGPDQGDARDSGGGYGEPYRPPSAERDYGDDRRGPRREYSDDQPRPSTYSKNEIVDAGHTFFGTVSQGLANVIEYAFQEAGRPNGYVLGEDAGGAFVAGLRYGEGTLYTKDAGNHKVFWQGPSVGYDFGAEGSKTMVLVYNLRDISDIYNRYAGIQGSAYVVGGVGIQFQKYGDVVLAPIRSGLGLRLGANIGYLKYTRAPTWNPF